MKRNSLSCALIVALLLTGTNASANTPLTDKLANLVAQGYEIQSVGMSQRQSGSTLYYNVVSLLQKDRVVVQCFQTWDAYFQEQFHRCIRLG